MMDVSEIQNQIRQFTIERDWEQYHSPKNLTIALAEEEEKKPTTFPQQADGGIWRNVRSHW